MEYIRQIRILQESVLGLVMDWSQIKVKMVKIMLVALTRGIKWGTSSILKAFSVV